MARIDLYHLGAPLLGAELETALTAPHLSFAPPFEPPCNEIVKDLEKWVDQAKTTKSKRKEGEGIEEESEPLVAGEEASARKGGMRCR